MNADGDEIDARIAAVHGAYEGLWADFLRNRWQQAEERATAFLRVIETVPAGRRDAELFVAEADFWYILGAVRGNEATILLRALSCYERSLSLPGGGNNFNARRMCAEALMRLRRYEDAFAAFGDLTKHRGTPWEELEAAPFRLRHDATMCRRLGRLGRLSNEVAVEAAAALDHIAESVAKRGAAGTESSPRWPLIADLGAEDIRALRQGLFDDLMSKSEPYPAMRFSAWAPDGGSDPLNAAVDWARADAEYMSERVSVLDGFFSAEALAEIWTYAREAPCFRTVRRGFLGAFPADGNLHPLLLATARSLERRMPRAFEGHPLGLWWMFKYTEVAPKGIGIHADAAAVNVNIWLTPDEARRSGGGLDIFMHVPPDEADVMEINREFATEADESGFRDKLTAAGSVRHVDYRQNRAVIFVSDLYHASEPFVFVNSEEQPRVNLTFLFGDRIAGRRAAGTGHEEQEEAKASKCLEATLTSTGCPGGDDGWDLFD